MSYNTKYFRFVVDVSDSRVALDMRADFVTLRVRKVFVGPMTPQEANSFLTRQLPSKWTAPQKQEVSLEITTRLGGVIHVLTEICKEFEDGMSTDEAMKVVQETHQVSKLQAFNRLKDFDSLVATKLKEVPNSPPPPLLKKGNDLDEGGLRELTGYLTFSGFTTMIEELGTPYIFEIDPFTKKSDTEWTSHEGSFSTLGHYS